MRNLHSRKYKQFLRNLNEGRHEAGLTQAQVAQALDKPQSYVSKCERGERTVDAIDVLMFAKAYGVDLDYFFKGIATSK